MCRFHYQTLQRWQSQKQDRNVYKDVRLNVVCDKFKGDRNYHNLFQSIDLINNPKSEMAKGPRSCPTQFLFALCLFPSMSLSLSLFNYSYPGLTHACSKPPDILSNNTSPGLSGCSLDRLPRIPSSVPVLRPQTLLRYIQRGSVKHQEQVTYVSYNQAFLSKLCIFQSAVNHI